MADEFANVDASSVSGRWLTFVRSSGIETCDRHGLIHPDYRIGYLPGGGLPEMIAAANDENLPWDSLSYIQPSCRTIDGAATTTGVHLTLFRMATALDREWRATPERLIHRALDFLIGVIGLDEDRLCLTTPHATLFRTLYSEFPHPAIMRAWRARGLRRVVPAAPFDPPTSRGKDNHWEFDLTRTPDDRWVAVTPTGSPSASLRGPHYEIHYADRNAPEDASPFAHGGRFVELANFVFPMAFGAEELPLPAETAIGIDRVELACDDLDEVFHVPSLRALWNDLESLAEGPAPCQMADCVRTLLFMHREDEHGAPIGVHKSERKSLLKRCSSTGTFDDTPAPLASVLDAVASHPEATFDVDLSAYRERVGSDVGRWLTNRPSTAAARASTHIDASDLPRRVSRSEPQRAFDHELADRVLTNVTEPTSDTLGTSSPGATNRVVTRFAPSPTGALHLGNLLSALLNAAIARRHNGSFSVRIDDTGKDHKDREAWIRSIRRTLLAFGLETDRTVSADGEPWSHRQSQRHELYRFFARQLLRDGAAYPCFCSDDDEEERERQQRRARVPKGYYGSWAVCYTAEPQQVRARLDAKRGFTLRLRPTIPDGAAVRWRTASGEHSVVPGLGHRTVLRSDGSSLHHLASVVDDHLQGVSLVLRGRRWESETPIQMGLFRLLGWTPPTYAFHPEVRMAGSRKKLAKSEAGLAVNALLEQGFPSNAIVDHLMTLVFPSFTAWRGAHPDRSALDFPFSLEELGHADQLVVEFEQLTRSSQLYISRLAPADLYRRALAWAREFDVDLAVALARDQDRGTRFLCIERREGEDCKLFRTWADIRTRVGFLFREIFDRMPRLPFDRDPLETVRIAGALVAPLQMATDKQHLAELCGAAAARVMRPAGVANPTTTALSVLRAVLTRSSHTPGLWDILEALGRDEAARRLRNFAGGFEAQQE